MVCSRGSGRSQLKSVSGADRVRLCGHVKLSLMGVGAYLFGEGYPSPMFQSGVKSFTNVSARKIILHQ